MSFTSSMMDSEAFCNLYNIAISAACRFDDAFPADAASVFSPIMWGEKTSYKPVVAWTTDADGRSGDNTRGQALRKVDVAQKHFDEAYLRLQFDLGRRSRAPGEPTPMRRCRLSACLPLSLSQYRTTQKMLPSGCA